jgi:branched-chain amino acid aminotransferase
MICTLSKHEAERNGYADALMLDYRGQIAECTGANVFLVIDGEIHTPAPDCFLDGITRRTVMDLARRRQYKVIERAVFPDDLKRAQEIFITGTAAEVTPVGEIGELKFTPGAVTRALMADYAAEVRKAPSQARAAE